MKPPRVSILIPTYNYARFLPEAIESVLAQDFDDYEVLIVDDGSADNTAEVVAPYCKRDRRISFEVNRTNLGMVANWNVCLKKARGEYVKYLFGDDKLAESNALSKLVALLASKPSVSLATSARRIINEASHPIETWNQWKKAGVHNGRSVIFNCLEKAQNLVGEPTAVMFRRSLGERGFNPAYRQLVDLEMWFHLLEQGDMAYTPEELCCFRTHGAQQTEVNKVSMIGHKEMLMLFSTCCDQPWYRESTGITRASMLWSLRNLRNTCPPADFKVLENRVRAKVPKLVLLIYWLIRRTARPFENLNRSARKRILRWKQRQQTA